MRRRGEPVSSVSGDSWFSSFPCVVRSLGNGMGRQRNNEADRDQSTGHTERQMLNHSGLTCLSIPLPSLPSPVSPFRCRSIPLSSLPSPVSQFRCRSIPLPFHSVALFAFASLSIPLPFHSVALFTFACLSIPLPFHSVALFTFASLSIPLPFHSVAFPALACNESEARNPGPCPRPTPRRAGPRRIGIAWTRRGRC